jgi:hypothetical protein
MVGTMPSKSSSLAPGFMACTKIIGTWDFRKMESRLDLADRPHLRLETIVL